MSNGQRRRAWKALAAHKRTPGGFMPLLAKKNQRRANRNRRWQGGDQ